MNNEELIMNNEKLNVGASIARPLKNTHKNTKTPVGAGLVSAQKNTNKTKNATTSVGAAWYAAQGITLISLVITVIIMLILAGVALNLTIGERGIFETAQSTKDIQKIAEYKDNVEISRTGVAVDNLGKVTLDKLIEEIYKDKIVPEGRINKLNETQAKMVTEEGYVFIITADGIEYIDKEENIPNPNLKEGDLIINTPTWDSNTHKASVTITKGSNVESSLQMQYQVNSTTGTWTTGTSVSNLKLNDTVYARLWNGLEGGNYASLKITEKTAPTVTVNITGTSTNSITASATSSDAQAGMPSSPTYTFYIKKTSEEDTAYVQKQSSTTTTCTFTGLTQNTSYTVKVTTKDIAGNTGSGTKETTTQIQKYTISFNGNGATTGSMGTQQFSHGTSQNLNANQFAKTGYVFKGWSTSASGGKVYNDKQSITVTSNMTLYAVWEQIKISLNIQQTEIIAGNTYQLTATITPEEAKNVKLSWTSSDNSVATVNANGLVTGISCGYATITVSNGTYTTTALIQVDEYLQYYGDLKTSKTGGFTLYRNGNTDYDDNNTSNGLYANVSNSGNAAAYISNNRIDLSKVGQLIFNVNLWNNYSGLGIYFKAGITNTRNANDASTEDWVGANGFTKRPYSEYSIEVGETICWCSNVDSGYIKIFLYHGNESDGFTVWMKNNFILAKP